MTGEAWRQYLQTYVALRRAIGFTMQREVRLLQGLRRASRTARPRRPAGSGERPI